MSRLYFNAISEDDINYILEIEGKSFSRPWSYTSFLNELLCPHAYIFVARHKNINGFKHIIAYLCFRVFENEMHILKIAVENKWRRNGIASRLLDNYLKDVTKRKVQAAFLEVRLTNVPAISFYYKLGFTLVGRRPNYYSNAKGKEDALLMMKDLKEAK